MSKTILPIMDIFDIHDERDFEKKALNIFRYQAQNNLVYKKFIALLGVDPFSLSKIENIPFLPVEFFKFYDLLSSKEKVAEIFTSSGTTGTVQSRHLVTDLLFRIGCRFSYDRTEFH